MKIGDSTSLKRIGEDRLSTPLDSALRPEKQVSPAADDGDGLWGAFNRVILPTLGAETRFSPLNTEPVSPEVLLDLW